VAAWEALKNRFKAVKEADDQDDEDFGEIPEEYLDQIMFSLMKDPVILPTSKAVVDRSTIQGHLLSDPHDPFNRMPLKIEDVIEDAELKAKINAWRDDMRSKAKTSREEKMDTTEG
jgi:ubiquitin conjugation factor E4 B